MNNNEKSKITEDVKTLLHEMQKSAAYQNPVTATMSSSIIRKVLYAAANDTEEIDVIWRGSLLMLALAIQTEESIQFSADALLGATVERKAAGN